MSGRVLAYFGQRVTETCMTYSETRYTDFLPTFEDHLPPITPPFNLISAGVLIPAALPDAGQLLPSGSGNMPHQSGQVEGVTPMTKLWV